MLSTQDPSKNISFENETQVQIIPQDTKSTSISEQKKAQSSKYAFNLYAS